jgi:hypothetical protein
MCHPQNLDNRKSTSLDEEDSSVEQLRMKFTARKTFRYDRLLAIAMVSFHFSMATFTFAQSYTPFPMLCGAEYPAASFFPRDLRMPTMKPSVPASL